MQVLTGSGWRSGYLDEPGLAESTRVRVRRYLRLCPVDDLYFERGRSLLMLRNYLLEYGVRDVLRKVRSRTDEEVRNNRWLAVGEGNTVGHSDTGLRDGADVLFICTVGPRGAERVMVPDALVTAAAMQTRLPIVDLLLHGDCNSPVPNALAMLAGWSPHSGEDLPASPSEALLAAASLLSLQPTWTSLSASPSPVATQRDGVQPAAMRPRAALHGYGAYAKTIILPNLQQHLDIARVVDLDPYQLGPMKRPWVSSTQPWDTDGDDLQVVVLAGYHHTHAAEAAAALGRGRVVIIEKPPATQLSDLTRLADLMARGGRVSVSYQRRYSPLLDKVRRALPPGEPVTYRAVVFEEPLPSKHWYRWPSSRTRLVSNGVHWIDEFLSLTGYAMPVRGRHEVVAEEESSTFVEQADGSFMTMSLSSRGANSFGLRDFVEIRAGSMTARITDGSRLELEQGYRRQHSKVRRLDTYAIMYEQLGRAAAAGIGLDTMASATAATRVALTLEDQGQLEPGDLAG